MTWVIAAGTILGYGAIISDVCVTYENNDGRLETKDCLQKIYWIAPSITAGFAGSVRIGFELLKDLTGFLRIPLEEQGTGSWIPQWVAENWQDRAKSIFNSNSDVDKTNGSAILMVCAHPTEDHGTPRDPRIYVIKMKSPDFEPLVVCDCSKIFSIGSGSDVPAYMEALQKLLPEDGYHPLMQLDVGNMGGWASGLAFQLSLAIKKNPEEGISKHLLVGVVARRRFRIIPNDWSEIENGELIEFRMPKLATSWSELNRVLSGDKLSLKTAISRSGI